MDAVKLRSFVVLAEELHFSRAAARLGISQSTLSLRLRSLETELDARLFDRSTRRVTLTEAGSRLLADAPTALAVIAETAAAVHATADEGDRIRLGCSPAARQSVVRHIVRRYRGDAPTARVRLYESASGELLRWLWQGRLDACVSYCTVTPQGLRSEPLAQLQPLVALPAADPRAQLESVLLADLSDLPLVLFADADSDGYNATAVAACEAAGFTPRTIGIPRARAAFEFCTSGGFTFVPSGALRDWPDTIALVPLAGPAPVLSFDLVWHASREAVVAPLLAAARAEHRDRS
ncbi:LysR family transcriptional regulator [Solirubrobacter soli]|uniref:LysR family transcriptional regulator n=1 Tax=Solirubrobacter soli TaxID=363832 RepID=UPI0003F6F4AC|nr:LysR family transcriptional regulator [Solirubrobacter soli]